MSFTKSGSLSSDEMNFLRRKINEMVPIADGVMEESKWLLGLHGKRTFPPGIEIMVDYRLLYMNRDASQVVYLIRGGYLVDLYGRSASLETYDANFLIRVYDELCAIVDTRNNVTSMPAAPAPEPQQHRGFWRTLLHDLLGL